jgi:hypothetical protein
VVRFGELGVQVLTSKLVVFVYHERVAECVVLVDLVVEHPHAGVTARDLKTRHCGRYGVATRLYRKQQRQQKLVRAV